MRDAAASVGGCAMTRCGRFCLAAVLVLVTASNGRSAAPPASPRWVAGELHRANHLAGRADQAALKGDFTLALRLSREVVASRRALLKDGHWQTVEAAGFVERWERL